MGTVPENFNYDADDMLNRVHYLIESVHYKIEDMDDRNLEEEKVRQYHFLMGVFTDLRILEEQLKLFVKKVEK